MTKRKTIKWFIITVALIFLVMGALILWMKIKFDPETTNSEAVRFGKSVEEKLIEEEYLDFSQMPFEWDEAFHFGVYSDPDGVLKEHGIKKSFELQSTVYMERHELLVFTKESKIMCLVYHDLFSGEIRIPEKIDRSVILKRIKSGDRYYYDDISE